MTERIICMVDLDGEIHPVTILLDKDKNETEDLSEALVGITAKTAEGTWKVFNVLPGCLIRLG